MLTMVNLSELPPQLEALIATVLFGFVIGLEVHSYRRANNKDLGFGTTRTFTLLALSGFVLAALDPHLWLFTAGLIAISGLLALQYRQQLNSGEQSLLPTLIALITYVIGPLALQQPLWLLILYIVVVLLVLGEKPGIRHFSNLLQSTEAATLAKFMIMAGLILPMLPDHPIESIINVTYHQLWLSVVVVSGISYISYIIQTYFFPDSGVLLTGALGGLYSSTAATVVLSKRARNATTNQSQYAPAIILASAMMYLRLMALILILGHIDIALQLAIPFTLVTLLSLLVTGVLYRRANAAPKPASTGNNDATPVHHPLEFSTAVVFAFLFVVFAGITQLVIVRYGTAGLHWLSFIIGFTDVDPFILALLAGKYSVDLTSISAAILIATASNNLLKAAYAAIITRQGGMLRASLVLCLISVVSLIYVALE